MVLPAERYPFSRSIRPTYRTYVPVPVVEPRLHLPLLSKRGYFRPTYLLPYLHTKMTLNSITTRVCCFFHLLFGPLLRYIRSLFFSMGPTLDSLPDEIIQHVFSFLPFKSAVCLLQTSTHLRRIAGERALWRNYCLRDFQHWDERHHINDRSATVSSSKDWQYIYHQRVNNDRRTTTVLDHIVATQQYRIGKFQVIALHGYDAKDTILRHLRVGDDAEDVLARR